MFEKDRTLKLDIVTPSGTRILTATGKQFSTPSHINSVTGRPENILMIKGRTLPEVEADSLVYIISYMRTGERIRYSGKITLSTELQLNILLDMGSAMKMEERRRYFKVEADISCIITQVTDAFGKTNDVPSKARIRNLNIGGVFLCVSDVELHKGDVIELSVDLENETRIIAAEVLRVQLNAAGDIMGYGCRFSNITPKIEAVLAKYVYRTQLEDMKKNAKKANEE